MAEDKYKRSPDETDLNVTNILDPDIMREELDMKGEDLDFELDEALLDSGADDPAAEDVDDEEIMNIDELLMDDAEETELSFEGTSEDDGVDFELTDFLDTEEPGEGPAVSSSEEIDDDIDFELVEQIESAPADGSVAAEPEEDLESALESFLGGVEPAPSGEPGTIMNFEEPLAAGRILEDTVIPDAPAEPGLPYPAAGPETPVIDQERLEALVERTVRETVESVVTRLLPGLVEEVLTRELEKLREELDAE